MALYCDNDVRWGGKAVGGIRISKLSGIDKPVSAPIAINRSLREIYTVEPLIVEEVNWGTVADKKVIEINNCKNAADLAKVKSTLTTFQKTMPENEFARIVAAGQKKKVTFESLESHNEANHKQD